MANWTLYHTQGCHLCEQALAVITPVLAGKRLTCVDIIDDEALIAQYQTSIPVLKSPAGVELFWPFNTATVVEFLQQE